MVLQAGDCAEPITDTTTEVVQLKAQALNEMGRELEARSGLPAVEIGRIGGQYAKPRSQMFEKFEGRNLPTYRGALVNDPHPSEQAREHDAQRLIRGRASAAIIHDVLNQRKGKNVWTSHEALVLDYEVAHLRPRAGGRVLLGSAHTVWVGARTNQIDHAHIALASNIINPVGCKVSVETSEKDLVALAETLNPHREAGKLIFISRMGRSIGRLPGLMEAIKREGHPVVWLCDPMHGNTRTATDGRKTRYVDVIVDELVAFQEAARTAGVTAGGVHLETTIDQVRECLVTEDDKREEHEAYTTNTVVLGCRRWWGESPDVDPVPGSA